METCPTCSSPVTIEGGPTTHFYVPASEKRIKELEYKVKYWEDKEVKLASCCVENERGIEIAKEVLAKILMSTDDDVILSFAREAYDDISGKNNLPPHDS